MATVREIEPTREAICAVVNEVLAPYRGAPPLTVKTMTVEDIEVRLYDARPDDRIGWEKTYVVVVADYGPFGFCDQEVTG